MLQNIRIVAVFMIIVFSNQTTFCIFQKLRSFIDNSKKLSFLSVLRYKQSKPTIIKKSTVVVPLKTVKFPYENKLRFIIPERTVSAAYAENLLKNAGDRKLSETEKWEKVSKEGVVVGGRRLYSMNGIYYISECSTDNVDDAIRAYYAVHGKLYQPQKGDIITLRLDHMSSNLFNKKKIDMDELQQRKARCDRWASKINKQTGADVCHSDAPQL